MKPNLKSFLILQFEKGRFFCFCGMTYTQLFLRFFTTVEFIPLINFFISVKIHFPFLSSIYLTLQPFMFTVFCLLHTFSVSDEG